MSRTAAVEAVGGNYKCIQRAHGVIEGRLDRYDRTIKLLEGFEMPFDEWWKFYKEHDTTVMITRTEHGSNKKFKIDELIELPPRELGLFTTSGFGFKMRKRKELVWLREYLEKNP